MTPGLPRWIYVPAALGALFVVLPLIAVAAKVDWSRFLELISSESSVTALVLSLKTATASTVLCVVLGVPMALVLARSGSRQGVTRTLPLEIYLQREADADAAVALSLVLVVVAAVVVLGMGGARFGHGPFEAERRQ